MGWFDEELKLTGFRNFSNNYTSPGIADWTLSGKGVALHSVSGPAFFSITELTRGSTLEDIKKVHYRAMSEAKGFKELSCLKTSQGAESCEVLLSNWTAAKAFYAVFYHWKVGERTFALVVRNAQPTPNKKIPEEAAEILIAKIK